MNQTAGTLFLIRPSHFGFNPETARSNSFQHNIRDTEIQNKALKEFNAFADLLESENIQTLIKNDLPERVTPDAVFPNNWVSFHHDGTVIVYPMESLNRRKERRMDLIEQFQEESEYLVNSVIDLTEFEKKGQFLEGTGSMVFDHINRKVYMAQSSRSHPAVLEKVCAALEYDPVIFRTADFEGNPVYHTNVLLTVGTRFAVLCRECISLLPDQKKIREAFDKDEKQVVEISGMQMAAFAGNMLEVHNRKEDPFLVLSEKAFNVLSKSQIRILEQFATLLPANIPTIEKIGGGSVRCMMAEVFLPLKKSEDLITVRKPKNQAEFDEYFELRWKLLA